MRCLAVAGFAAMNVMLLSVSVWSGNASDMTFVTRDLFHWLSALIVLPAAAYAGQPFYQSAWRAVRNRALNMDVPITIGVSLALALSLYETATVTPPTRISIPPSCWCSSCCAAAISTLRCGGRPRLFAGNLASLKGEFAHRLDANGALTRVPISALQPGDRVLVRPGENIPADGAVLDGISAVDDGLVTGETLPRNVDPGAAVYAGSINGGGALTVKVSAAGTGTLVDEVERLLDKATAAKSRSVRLADRAARLYAPVVHTAAALTAIGWLLAGASLHAAIVAAIAVLIITCPCAIALAIPAVQVVAAGQLFRAGIILNNGDAIERMAEIDTVVFDKTGTLTLPDPVVDASAVAPDLLGRAARLALSSRHPLAAALARSAGERVPYPGAVEEPGRGVRVLIDGEEARLGSPAFCGLSAATVAAGDDSTASWHRVCAWRQNGADPDPAAAAARRDRRR